jgi:hypothetical protein
MANGSADMTMLPRPLSLNRFVKFIALFGCLQGLTVIAYAVTVPDDYPTIQAALDDIRWGNLPSGELIQVRPGTYHEALKFASAEKAFNLKAIGNAGNTIIDATGIPEAAFFIHDTPIESTIDGFTVTGGNNAAAGGGGLTIQRATVNLAHCIIEGNYGSQGGGVHFQEAVSLIENSTIRDNVAASAGGGVAVLRSSTVTIVDSEIVDNVAVGGDYQALGGGIRVTNSSAVIRRSIVSGNAAKLAGGGIYAFGSADDPFGMTTVTVDNSLISKNQVIHNPDDPPAAGGGMHIEGESIAYLTESTISDNVSSGRGGGLNTFKARYEIVGTLIEFNQAMSGSGGGIYGYSQYPSGSSVLLLDSVVRNNTGVNAGGVSVIGNACGTTNGACADLEVDHSLVDGNRAVDNAGGIGVSGATVSIAASQVFDNQTTGGTQSFGGGIRIVDAVVDVSSTDILGNYAANSGGGVYVGPDANVTVDNSIVYSNYVEDPTKGGGVQTSSIGPPTGLFSGTVIADNSGFQIREESCPPNLPAPILSYHDNIISDIAASALYKSPCAPPSEVYDIDDFNALSPGLKTIGNVDIRPAYSHLTKLPLADGRNVVSWVQLGGTNADIANLGSFPGTHGSVDVFPACSTTYTLGSEMVTVAGTGADELMISDRLIRNAEVIEALQGIDATNVTIDPGADVTFRAGNFVFLGPSFTVEAGGTFQVQIEPGICP